MLSLVHHPVNPSKKDWFKPTNLVTTIVQIMFICPVTYSVPRDGKNKPMCYEMKMPNDWVRKYGPALKISFEVLRVAFAVGRLAGLPLPNVSGVSKKTNPFNVLNDNLALYMENSPDLSELSTAFGKELNTSLPDEDPSISLSEDIKKKIQCSYNEVKEIAKENGDPHFAQTGLSKVMKDDYVDDVLNDPKIKALYQEMGPKCTSLTAEEMNERGADLGVVVKEGELLKKSKSSFKKEWDQRYFVLRRNGSLTFYSSKDKRKEDPLGVSGRSKPIVIKVANDDENGSFEILC